MSIVLAAVVLRPPEPEDLERIYQYRNDSAVTDWLGGFLPGMARKDVAEWIELHRQKRDEVLWVIADRENRALGHVGLYRIDHRLRHAEFAIVLGDRNCWGKGIGREVCAAVLRFGFLELNLRQIRLGVLETNARARRLYARLGFREDGRLRDDQFRNGRYVDSILMSLMRTEWQAGSEACPPA